MPRDQDLVAVQLELEFNVTAHGCRLSVTEVIIMS